MTPEEKLKTIEQKYEAQLQEKNELILQLESELTEIKADRDLKENTHTRLMEASQKQISGLKNQIGRLNGIQIDAVASELKKIMGLIRP